MDKTYAEVMDDHYTKELAKEGHTIEDFMEWPIARQEQYTHKICGSFNLDTLTKAQADEAVELGYLQWTALH